VNNEPVAWLIDGDLYEYDEIDGETLDGIPLYAHPSKDLTDEEIIEIRDSCYVQSGIDEWEFDDVVFARAILRKAQE